VSLDHRIVVPDRPDQLIKASHMPSSTCGASFITGGGFPYAYEPHRVADEEDSCVPSFADASCTPVREASPIHHASSDPGLPCDIRCPTADTPAPVVVSSTAGRTSPMTEAMARISGAIDRFGVQLAVLPAQYKLLSHNATVSRADLPSTLPSSEEYDSAPRAEERARETVSDRPLSTAGRSTVAELEQPEQWSRKPPAADSRRDLIGLANLWASLLFLEILFESDTPPPPSSSLPAGSPASASADESLDCDDEDAESDRPTSSGRVRWTSRTPPQFAGWAPIHAAPAVINDGKLGIIAFASSSSTASAAAVAGWPPLRAHGRKLHARVISVIARLCARVRSGHLYGIPRFVMASDLFTVFGGPTPVLSPARIGSVPHVSRGLAEAVALERWTYQLKHRGRAATTFSADAERVRKARGEGSDEAGGEEDVNMAEADVETASGTSRSSSMGSVRPHYVSRAMDELAKEFDDEEIDRFAEERLYYIDNANVARYYAEEDRLAGANCGGISTPYWTPDGRKMYAPPGHPMHQPSYEPHPHERAQMEEDAEAARIEALRPPPRRPRVVHVPHSFEERVFLGTRYTAPAEALGRRPAIDVFRAAHDVQCTRAFYFEDFTESVITSAAAAAVILDHAATGAMRHCATYTTPTEFYQGLHDALLPLAAAARPQLCRQRPGMPPCFTCIVFGVLFALVAATHNGAPHPRMDDIVHRGVAAAFSRAFLMFQPVIGLIETQRLPGWRAKNVAFARCLSQRLMKESESVTRSEYRWTELRIGSLAGHDSASEMAAPTPSRLDLVYTVAAINEFCNYKTARVARSVTGEPTIYVIDLYLDMIRGAFLLAAAIPPPKRANSGSNATRRQRRAHHATSTTSLAESEMAKAIRNRTVSDMAWRMMTRVMTNEHYLPQVDPLAMSIRWLGRMVFSDRARGSGPSGSLVVRTMATAGFLKCVAAIAPSPDILLHSLAYGLEPHNHSPVYSLLHAVTCEPRASFFVTMDLLLIVSHTIRTDVAVPRDPNDPDYKKFLPLADFCDEQRDAATRLYLKGYGGDSEAPEGSTWVILPTEQRWPLEFLAFAACSFADAIAVEMIATDMRTLSIYLADSSIDRATLTSKVKPGERRTCLDGINATIRLARAPRDGLWLWRRTVDTIPRCGCGFCHASIKHAAPYPYKQWAHFVHVPTDMIRDLCAMVEVLHGEVPYVAYDHRRFVSVKCARSATRLASENTAVPFSELVIVPGMTVADVFPVWRSPLADTTTSFDAAGLSPFTGSDPLILDAALVAPLISVTTESDKAALAAQYGAVTAVRRRIFTSANGRRDSSGRMRNFQSYRPPASM